MSSKALTEDERASLNLILEDLRFLFGKVEILQDEIDGVLQNLKSEEVKSYLQNLRYGSKPETALREAFIAGKSVLLKYLFGAASPEVRSDGFLDYLVKDEMGRGIALELKPLFEAVVKTDKAGKPILEKLKQKKLRPEDYKEQIIKYIRKGEVQFVILTDLKDWFFYSKELTPAQFKHFCAIGFFDFVKEYDVIGNLRDYLERKEFESIRYDLDKWFLESLKTWVKKLSEVDFTVDDKRKLELIIGLINKFIFVQTLDDYGVIEFNWIRKRWNYHEQMWQRKGKLMVLTKFFDELDDWFFLYYDTELFREKILQYVKKDDENIDKLYRNLQLVLGLTYLQVPFGALKGIMQYNFRYIDEDVLGKAYETFLGEVRKEEGVYYTPKYITQYIAENTVGKVFDEVSAKIREKLEREKLEDVKELVSRFISIKILDPACGSGSFLIKAIRIIVKRYKELSRLIEGYIKKYSNYAGTLDLPQETRTKLELLSEISEIIGPKNDRELIARILVRHIHGVDLDKRALEVAKINIWLEAIKLAPKEFRYDKLPPETNYILPNLEMNLCNGDSLIGLPEELTMKYLADKHQTDLITLFNLRQKYLENPMNPSLVEEIEDIKHEIRNELDENFKEYLKIKKALTQVVDQTKPFHWALDFWYVFFDQNGVPLSEEQSGFEVVIGNPPYLSSKEIPIHFKPIYKISFQTATGQYDIYSIFMEKSFILMREKAKFGFIIPEVFLARSNFEPIRAFILDNCVIHKIEQVKGVFEDPTVANIIIVYSKNTKDIAMKKNNILKFGKYETLSDFCSGLGRVIQLSQQYYCTTRKHRFVFIEDIKMKRILDKIRSSAISFGDLIIIHRGEELGRKSSKIHDKYQEGDNKILFGENVQRYLIAFENKFINEKDIQKDKKMYFSSKIVIRQLGEKINAAFDPDGEYVTLQTIYNILLKDKRFNPLYVLGIINSALINFYYSKVFQEKRLFPRILLENIKELPIYLAKPKQQKTMVELVDRIILLKKAYHKFLEIWDEWSIKLKNNELRLHQILTNDADLIRRGEFNKTWTSKATFYPTEPETSNPVFNGFKIRGECKRNLLAIYGLNENDEEELVYEMGFGNRDLMLHVYCSLLEILQSRAKIKTLSQLFAKTTVPIIKEVNRSSNELTPNIIKKVRDEFEDWLRQNKIENVEADIVKIDNEIGDLEAEIDALVFKLYGLEEDEIKVVFDSLKTPTIYQGKVLEFFRKL